MLPSPMSPSEESIPPKFTFPEVPKAALHSTKPGLFSQDDPSTFHHGSTSAFASLIHWKKDPRQV